MNIVVGKDYVLEISEDLKREPVAWATNSSRRKKYVTWNDVNGKIVNVRSKTVMLTTYYIVVLIDSPFEPFYVSSSLLREVSNSFSCTCSIGLLMSNGCKCGAFKKELNS